MNGIKPREEFLRVRETKRKNGLTQKLLYLPIDTQFEVGQYVMVVAAPCKMSALPTQEEQTQ